MNNPHKFDLDREFEELEKAVEFQQGVEIPLGTKQGGSRYDPLINRMEVGDSVELPKKFRTTLRDRCRVYKKFNKEFAFREWTSETFRVWRIK